MSTDILRMILGANEPDADGDMIIGSGIFFKGSVTFTPARKSAISSVEFFSVTLKPEGDLALIGSEHAKVKFSGKLAKDTSGHVGKVTKA